MKKILYLVCFIFSLFFGTLVLTGCQEKVEGIDGMYQKDGFYFPIETKNLEIESATLMAEMTSSKIVDTSKKDELYQLSILMCKKKPEYIGVLSQEEFQKFYFDQEQTQGFIFTLYFSSEKTSQEFGYSFFISTQGRMYSEDEEEKLYHYTENNFIDYDAVSVFYHSWKV
ncbi:MAG: hypothetical protein NC310_03875 [Roseburia sp.]|nr:hypothetical protein [Anaeroplasma bactoclasticum]MCM1196198.1 hypothetical protein [Roseburia sp.]MCM1557278.1 hypothetical protein [Anaeroplasma bactoclasticum]